jgi:hypothetical protein
VTLPHSRRRLHDKRECGGGYGIRQQETSPPHCQFLFGRNKEEADGEREAKSTSSAHESEENEKKQSVPFFGRFMGNNRQSQATSVDVESDEMTTLATPATGGSPVATLEKGGEERMKVEREEETPESLRAKAERARLEAERMDAELTLMKIDKLAKQLSKAKTKGDSVDDLQRQLDDLQAKLRGEPPKPRIASKTPSSSSVESDSMTSTVTESSAPSTTDGTTDTSPPSSPSTPSSKSNDLTDDDIFASAVAQMMSKSNVSDEDELTVEDLKLVPGFMLKIFAGLLEMDVSEDHNEIDKDELVMRWNMSKKQDFSFSKRPKPVFTQEQIDSQVQQIKELGVNANPLVSDEAKRMAGGNETQLALYQLTTAYYIQKNVSEMEEDVEKFLPRFIAEIANMTGLDAKIERLYPRCTRKEGEEPTEAQVDALMKTVLPVVKFSSTSKPEKVIGGYIIYGTHKYDNGNDLIDAIDNELEKSPTLTGKMTVLYVPDIRSDFIEMDFEGDLDFSNIENMIADEEEKDPILYITGTDITRDSNRLGLTVASILGIATSWYLSIYPFLLNDDIARRVDQELSLVDAGMQPDLTWLTDLSVPLFLTFMGLQLVHELAHGVVAAAKDVKLSVPVFVPSLITGVTSTVTTFKTLPKNSQDMFDISASGPLFGLAASALTLALGVKLTLVSDPTMLPALPLEILRQSTLGGGIIENVIPGSLYVPEGAPTNGIMISLHPVAIAGYISLIVNALSLLPIGCKSTLYCVVVTFCLERRLINCNRFSFFSLILFRVLL